MILIRWLSWLIYYLLGEEISPPQEEEKPPLQVASEAVELKNLPANYQDLVLFFMRIPKYYKGLPHQSKFLDVVADTVEDSIVIWMNEVDTDTQDYKANDIRSGSSVFDLAMQFTLRWEGGYVNHPSDPGGATNKGVIQATYNQYRDRKRLPRKSVKQITDAEVDEIYHLMYWTPALCEIMPPKLAIVMFDTAVNFGVGGSIMFLQDVLAVEIDGRFGPLTKAAYDGYQDKARLADAMVAARIQYRHTRVAQKPSQRVFLQGWLNRDNDLRSFIATVN